MAWNELLQFLKTLFSFNEAQPLLFTQFYFWAFFVVVFTGLSLIGNRRLLRNTFLFAASLFFYFKTSGLFVLILIFSTFFNFFAAKGIARTKRAGARKLWVAGSVVVNLAVLFYFKYAYFFTDIYNNLFHTRYQVFNYLAHWANAFGGHFNADVILLPVGISFFTFQTISYVVDVYRGDVKAVGNVLDFGFYVSFFPGLVAGPIVRASQFVPQLYKPFFLSRRQFGIAVFWILNGLFKKMVLSDYLAVNFIDRVFANPLMYTGFENLSALFAYSLQVYADFSGYTDIAVGVALLMGFHLPKNFNSPYKAQNPSQFWKRWHISLSSWLKDYLYIPLGGNRKATAATYLMVLAISLIVVFLSKQWWVTVSVAVLALVLAVCLLCWPKSRKKINTNINMMNTMLFGGLWHGASWNFMLWGGLNGLGILAYKIWRNRTQLQKTGMALAVFLLFLGLSQWTPAPFYNLAAVWSGIFCFGTLAGGVFHALTRRGGLPWVGEAWAVLMTFVFVTFTRLFFRSGSNLNPAEANEVAWNTAVNMVHQIGGKWNLSLIPSILYEYRAIFLLFAAGMLIHWLPDRFKRRYRLFFARLPIPVMLLAVVAAVFVIYQFITADLQSFIYFQF